MTTRSTHTLEHDSVEFIQRLADEFAKIFDFAVVEDFAVLTSRLWDPTMGVLLYHHGEPIFMSSCIMDVFSARDRCDVTNVPPLTGTNWDYYGINETTLPRVIVQGDVAVVCLGERKEPYPKLPLRLHEAEALRRPEADVLFYVSGQAMATANYQACIIGHDGYVAEQAPRLPNALGYDVVDTMWIPEDWYEPLGPGPTRQGTSTVTTAMGGKEVLEWVQMPLPGFNIFWVRRERKLEHQLMEKFPLFDETSSAVFPPHFGTS